MAEDDITQSGIRVGGWLPAVRDGSDAAPPPAGPRRLPGDPDPAATVGPAPAVPAPTGPAPTGPAPTGLGTAGSASAWPPAGPDRDASWPSGALRSTGARPPVGGGATPVAPGRHTASESLGARVAGPVVALATRVRGGSSRLRTAYTRVSGGAGATAGSGAESPATRVGAARARRHRRRVVLAVVALSVSVAALAYSARPPASPQRRAGVPAAAPTDPTPAPTAAPPTVVPASGAPALPGGPLLNVDQQAVPAAVSLSLLGTRDWRHWGGTGADSVQRKQRGTGEIQDPGGARLEHNAGVSGLTWTDGTPTAREAGTRAGVFQRGAGKSFSLAVAGSGDLRTVRLFVGTFSAGARLDVSLSGGGDPAVREVALARGDRFYQYVIHFRTPRDQRLLISWRALTVTGGQNDGVSLEAITVS
ncbi:hypothetical protein [Micromonospora robiginosa]|uniref:Uncharacterized protein n=1 Tax=Micromonospora robiginosa TaxID=2749844 RepID=A0A7L6BCP6_9ACTN|nr:hypothetical protein [Micromonospora ferruginea]QLQ39545.1 hypothetical protein H1D33_12355 [Micromonospora ferruginea]